MPLPVVLIHGYSSEGKTSDNASFDYKSIREIYGRLVDDLRGQGVDVVPVNVGRYVSLDDGVSIDDVSFAFDRVLHEEHPGLLTSGFDVIVHSTGALVARNWIRRRTKPGSCPVRHLIHLAGANLGSGWAHIGASQVSKFARLVQGVQRGLAVLNALELGSSWTIDLHNHFLQSGQDMFADYGVMEFCLIGSQVPPEYLIVPVRYGKEDGADGVVRVSSCNLNYNYICIGPTNTAERINWDKAKDYARLVTRRAITQRPDDRAFEGDYYQVLFDSRPGAKAQGRDADADATARPLIPMAIPYGTNHSDRGSERAIVSGSKNRDEVLPLVRAALECTPADYPGMVRRFAEATASTYERVMQPQHAKGLFARVAAVVRNVLDNPEGQYDPHSQLVFRVTDQHGQPVNDFSIFFNSMGGEGAPSELVNRLFEDKHKNDRTPNTINFYLRTICWDGKGTDSPLPNQTGGADDVPWTGKGWSARLPNIKGVSLEIDAVDPLTQRVLFLPLRIQISAEELQRWIEPHRTTIVDVQLMRLPHKVTFVLRGPG